jgi:twitching motility protein PilT
MSYSMSDLLQLVVAEGASDLHIRVGVPPVIRVHGILHRVEGPSLRRRTPRS